MARTPIHPGEILREELEILGISATEFARQLNVPTNRITGILNEKRAVTADTAISRGRSAGSILPRSITTEVSIRPRR